MIPELAQYGLPGIVIAGLAYAWRAERSRNDVLTDRMIEGMKQDAKESSARETSILMSLKDILSAVQQIARP